MSNVYDKALYYFSITRLAGAMVEITHEDNQYFGTLIDGGKRYKKENIYYLRLNHELIYLYGDTKYTLFRCYTQQ